MNDLTTKDTKVSLSAQSQADRKFLVLFVYPFVYLVVKTIRSLIVYG